MAATASQNSENSHAAASVADSVVSTVVAAASASVVVGGLFPFSLPTRDVSFLDPAGICDTAKPPVKAMELMRASRTGEGNDDDDDDDVDVENDDGANKDEAIGADAAAAERELASAARGAS